MKYRKKPVVVDAELYRKGLEDGWEHGDMLAAECQDEEIENTTKEEWNELHKAELIKPFIDTLEGKHYITAGDYIITGVRGERYPCKHDIFLETYEKAEN